MDTGRRIYRRSSYSSISQRKDSNCSRLFHCGIFLLIVYGFLPIIIVFGLWNQKKWAWRLTLPLGLVEIAWIATEVILFYNLGFFFFYPIIAGMGVATSALCLLPSVRRFYFGQHIINEKIRMKSVREQETVA